MIVEDDPQIQLLLESVFDFYNITHSSAGTITLAKQKIENTIPFMIILDNSLPDGKGLDFIEFLYENFPCIRIVLFTGDFIDINQRKLKEKILLYAQKPSLCPIFEMIENRMNWLSCTELYKCFPQSCPKFEQKANLT